MNRLNQELEVMDNVMDAVTGLGILRERILSAMRSLATEHEDDQVDCSRGYCGRFMSAIVDAMQWIAWQCRTHVALWTAVRNAVNDMQDGIVTWGTRQGECRVLTMDSLLALVNAWWNEHYAWWVLSPPMPML